MFNFDNLTKILDEKVVTLPGHVEEFLRSNNYTPERIIFLEGSKILPVAPDDWFIDIYDNQTLPYGWNINDKPITLISTDSQDNQSGTGVRKVRIAGITTDFGIKTIDLDTHPTNGTLGVPVPDNFRVVYHKEAIETGAAGVSVGTTKLQFTDVTLKDLANIGVGETRSHNAQFTIPKGYFGILSNIAAMMSFIVDAAVAVKINTNPTDPYFREIHRLIQAPFFESGRIFLVDEKTDITMCAKGWNDRPVSGTMTISLYKKN